MTQWIGIKESCEILHVSRPTFDRYRVEYKLQARHSKGRVWFSREEVLGIFRRITLLNEPVSLKLSSTGTFESLKIDSATLDLRRLESLDPFGAVSLLCGTISLAAGSGKVRLIVDDSAGIKHLSEVGFFNELQHACGESISIEGRIPERGPAADSAALLSFERVTYRGGDRDKADTLLRQLAAHGFSENLRSYVGWIFGELADNSLTHAKGTCYLLVQRFEGRHDALAIGIGDVGVGIHNSLKTNPKHAALSDEQALIKAFKAKISSWDDEYNRGKGLSDVLKIAIGNQGVLRVDSGPYGVSMDFRNRAPEIIPTRPMAGTPGTRFCIVLYDKNFTEVTRSQADAIVETVLE